MATYPFALIVPKGTSKSSIVNEEFFEAINGTMDHKTNYDFWCPTTNCQAKLLLCAIQSDIHTTHKPYFRLQAGFKHLETCQYDKFYKQKSQKYDNTNFSLSDFTENIMQPKNLTPKKTSSSNPTKNKKEIANENKLTKIKNLKTFYNFCKFNSSDTPIGDSGMTIGDIFIHKFNFTTHKRPLTGFKLIELRINSFDPKNNTFLTYYGHRLSFDLPIQAQSSEIFKLIKQYILFPDGPRSMKDINLVVFAEIHDSKILIHSLNQIMEIPSS